MSHFLRAKKQIKQTNKIMGFYCLTGFLREKQRTLVHRLGYISFTIFSEAKASIII